MRRCRAPYDVLHIDQDVVDDAITHDESGRAHARQVPCNNGYKQRGAFRINTTHAR